MSYKCYTMQDVKGQKLVKRNFVYSDHCKDRSCKIVLEVKLHCFQIHMVMSFRDFNVLEQHLYTSEIILLRLVQDNQNAIFVFSKKPNKTLQMITHIYARCVVELSLFAAQNITPQCFNFNIILFIKFCQDMKYHFSNKYMHAISIIF